MNTIESAVNWMIAIANNSSHGYDQIYRWGERGDYDCSSLVITALEKAGIKAKSSGATYTGNMYNVLRKLGFKDVTSSCNLRTGAGMKRGDILLNHVHHVAMHIGNGQIVQASINERGTAKYGQPGDQKQQWGQRGEINIRGYYNYPWNCVLRYAGESVAPDSADAKNILLDDGWFGCKTARRTQQFFGTIMDGIVSGQPESNKKYWYCTSQDNAFEWVDDENAGGSDMALAWQNWLRNLGYYTGALDRYLGPKFVCALECFLRDVGLYKGDIDSSAGNGVCRAWQTYLNSH